MKKTKMIIALSALTLTVAGLFAGKPAKKFAPATTGYAVGYGYLFTQGGVKLTDQVKANHTAQFKTKSGSLVTIFTAPLSTNKLYF